MVGVPLGEGGVGEVNRRYSAGGAMRDQSKHRIKLDWGQSTMPINDNRQSAHQQTSLKDQKVGVSQRDIRGGPEQFWIRFIGACRS